MLLLVTLEVAKLHIWMMILPGVSYVIIIYNIIIELLF